VILLRDSDGNLDRRDGLRQAREAEPWRFKVIIGFAHTKRECWHLAGFEPKDDVERERLEKERQYLGFDPRTKSHELTAKHDHETDKRSAKRVLRALTATNLERELECLAVLSALRRNGQENGLRAFLDELETVLVPMFTQ